MRPVADPHGTRPPVPLQMIQRLLRQGVPAVDAIHDLQGPVRFQLPTPCFDPIHELCGLVGEPDAKQPVEGEGRVPNPGVAVVPIAFPADALREAAGRRGHDGAGRLEGQHFEGQGRTIDHLPPPAGVGALGEPAPPELDGFFKQLEAFLRGTGSHAALPGFQGLKDEHDRLPFLEGQVRHHRLPVLLQRHGRRQP